METEASRVQKLLIEQNTEISNLKNRIEQLEAALRDIAEWENWDGEVHYFSRGVARAALEGKDG